MKKIIWFVAFVFATTFSIAQVQPQDSVRKSLNIGANILHFTNPTDMSQAGFIRYRINQHAFRLTLFSGSLTNSYFLGDRTIPTSIQTTDSTVISRYNSFLETQSGVSIGYEKFARLKNSDRIELYAGIGVFGGTFQHYKGHNNVTYEADSFGVFQFNDSLSLITYIDSSSSFTGTQIGIIPYTGFLYNPDEIVSVGLELSLPILYNNTISIDKTQRKEGFYFNPLVSIHVVVNFDLSFEDKVVEVR